MQQTRYWLPLPPEKTYSVSSRAAGRNIGSHGTLLFTAEFLSFWKLSTLPHPGLIPPGRTGCCVEQKRDKSSPLFLSQGQLSRTNKEEQSREMQMQAGPQMGETAGFGRAGKKGSLEGLTMGRSGPRLLSVTKQAKL